MQRRFSSQSSVLQRAQQQLQGKRISTGSSRGRNGAEERKRDDSDLNVHAYLSKLNQKVSQAGGKQIKTTTGDDLSDLDLSDDNDEHGGREGWTGLSASRFVKKSHSQTLVDSDSVRRRSETLSGGSTLKKSATTPSFLNKSAPVYASAALQKAAQLGAKFAKQKRSADNLPDSESDFDISLSDESGSNVQQKKSISGFKGKVLSGKVNLQSNSSDEPKNDASKFLKKSTKPSFYVGGSDDEDGSDFGRDGNKFLKKSAVSKKPGISQSKTDSEEESGSGFLKKPIKKPQADDAKSSKIKTNNEKFVATHHGYLTSTPKKDPDGNSKLSRKAPSGAKFGLDSDEEDLEDFIKNLTPTSSPEIPPVRDHKPTGKATVIWESQEPSAVKSTPVKRPATPATKKTVFVPRDVDSSSMGSPVADESAQSIADSVNDEDDGNLFSGIHTNIMQLEDLEPFGVITIEASGPLSKPNALAKENYNDNSDHISEHDSIKKDVFVGLQTVDDLLVKKTVQKHDRKRSVRKESVIDSADEIGTEVEHSISEVLSEGTLKRTGSKTPGEVYADDTFVSQTESPSETRTSTKTVPDTNSEFTSEEYTRRRYDSKSQSYSDDFHSHGTDSDVEDFSSDDNSRTRTDSVTHSRSFTSYTESRTVTRSEKTPRKERRKERRKEMTKDAAVQADGATSATHQWLRDLDLSALGTVTGVDPLPVAMHVINPQALEALTSYSPSILAMNQTLLSQLRHTQESIKSSLRLHQSFMENIETDFSYTTLEDTKEFIHRHRRPKLTMEQALAEVRQEMEEGYR
ncbi:uncharacterized protein C19orf44-like [Patiria miniata]|uniref:DUF4614 domain-containing protein n=1 Tax=Patiria miniata TaxID=46514 RepID=A0A914AY55_PATMI|nr:uncharacterized protein C19orf44-like [Patiria miniata]XP_038068632.1 uncharacterized protein C19orf44-like [Patiria miniata]